MPATPSTSTVRTPRYQEGSVTRVKRAKGPDVWVYRWREVDDDGNRVQRKQIVGNVAQFPTVSAAKREVENLRAKINAVNDRPGKTTVADAWGHFQLHELGDDAQIERSPTTIDRYEQLFKVNILPHWKDVALEDVKAIQVEKWLKSLPYANGTKAKIRNVLCTVFNHAIRWELTDRNPISGPSKGAGVRQSSMRRKEPDVLSLEEMRAILPHVGNPAIRIMVIVAGATGLRRSELCGLKWQDVDWDNLLLRLSQGVVHSSRPPKGVALPPGKQSCPVVTKLKTKASRKPQPITEELAAVLAEWRQTTPYPTSDDWIFASHHDEGKWPYNPVAAMRYWIQRAARKTGCDKNLGWHTFRHSVATLLGQAGEDVKVVQELMRHASSRITQNVYQQANQTAKREAVKQFTGLFVMPTQRSADLTNNPNDKGLRDDP
jgi:integrase